MQIQRDDLGDVAYQINRYEPGLIHINQQAYHQSVIIRPITLLHPWRPTQLTDLQPEDFDSILEDKPSILLLGTGAVLQIPDQALLTPLFEKGIGVEFMDSKAACYTYTILASDKRNVAACILIL